VNDVTFFQSYVTNFSLNFRSFANVNHKRQTKGPTHTKNEISPAASRAFFVEKMNNRSKLKKILYILGAAVLIMSLTVWIFFTFYFEGALNKYAVPRLTEAARVATHGKYHLTLGRISYTGSSIFCKNFILQRTGYDSSEHGNTVKRISIDSVRFIGVSWWDAICGNDMRMTSLEMSQPKIYFTDIEKERETFKDMPNDTFANAATPKNLPVISFDSIVLRNCSIYLPERYYAGSVPSFSNIELKLTHFLLDSKTLMAQPLLYSERVDFSMSKISYPLADSESSLEVRNIRGSFSDSLLVIDSFIFKPLYSKQEYAARHRYSTPRLDLRCADIRIRGINFVNLIGGTNLTFRTCVASSWSLDFFSDRREPDDPRPPSAVLPNDIVRSITMPINVDSFILNHGYIHWGERWAKSNEAGTLIFTNTRIAAYPFCTDTLNALSTAPMEIDVSALFLGEAKVDAKLTYQIHDKALNYNIDATVGPFEAKKLNSQLTPNERIEVTDGIATHGIIRMNVRAGVATTTVIPQYHDLSLKVLGKDAQTKTGILEGIKTLIAKTFTIRGNNMGHEENKPFGATTSLRRTKDREFLEFMWLALRKSLGKVIGF
jgi:hypothetical protein